MLLGLLVYSYGVPSGSDEIRTRFRSFSLHSALLKAAGSSVIAPTAGSVQV